MTDRADQTNAAQLNYAAAPRAGSRGWVIASGTFLAAAVLCCTGWTYAVLLPVATNKVVQGPGGGAPWVFITCLVASCILALLGFIVGAIGAIWRPRKTAVVLALLNLVLLITPIVLLVLGAF